MSQHFYQSIHHGRPVCILMGWDRPLQRHFLVVSYTDLPQDADDEYLYSNLLDRHVTRHTDLLYYAAKLADLDLVVPNRLLQELARDAAHDIGNRTVNYAPDGTIASDLRA
ncbi:hypothetical protein [Cupriavidus basilensis]